MGPVEGYDSFIERLEAWEKKSLFLEKTRQQPTTGKTKVGQPCIHKGLVRDWLGTDTFQSNENVARAVGKNAEVDVMVSKTSYFAGWAEELETTRVLFSDFLDGLSSHHDQKRYYLAQATIVSRVRGRMVPGSMYGLARDLTVPEVIPACHLVSVNAWCSVGGPCVSSLHFDCYDNLLCVVRGTKLVRCCPFDDIHLGEDNVFEYGYGNHCQRDITLFPEYEEGKSLPRGYKDMRYPLCEFVLSGGDALYIPQGMWHQVYSHYDTNDKAVLAVNFWWDDPSTGVSQAYTRCIQYNKDIAEYAIQYLGEYALVACTHMKDVLQGVYFPITDTGSNVTASILRHVPDQNRRKLLLESCIAYYYSRGSTALCGYVSDMAYTVLPTLSLEERMCFWDSTTPIFIEYLTSGLSYLLEKEECRDPSAIYERLYATMDDCDGFSFPNLIAEKKKVFKQFLVHQFSEH